MKSSLADHVTISHDVLVQELDGEAVLLDLASESYFGLDDVGTRIWQLLNDHGSLRMVYETLLHEYDVEPARLQKDLLEHVSKLADAGLIVYGEPYAATP